MEMKVVHLSLDKQDASLKVSLSDLAAPSYFSWFHDWKTQSSFAKERERRWRYIADVLIFARRSSARAHFSRVCRRFHLCEILDISPR